MKIKIILIIWIIITLLSLLYNIYLLIENRRITERWEGAEDALGELESIR